MLANARGEKNLSSIKSSGILPGESNAQLP